MNIMWQFLYIALSQNKNKNLYSILTELRTTNNVTPKNLILDRIIIYIKTLKNSANSNIKTIITESVLFLIFIFFWKKFTNGLSIYATNHAATKGRRTSPNVYMA